MREYRIKDWDKNFENNRTREMKRMEWVPIPNRMDGDGYTELLDHDNGAAHLGAWLAIVEIASRREIRGSIPLDRRGHSAVLERMSRIKASVFDEVIPRLEKIGWIELVKESAQEPAENHIQPAQEPAPRAHAGTEWNGIEEKGINTPAHATRSLSTEERQPSQIRIEFEEDWPHFWLKVGKGAAYRAYIKARKIAPREKIMQGVFVLGPLIREHAKRQGITAVHPATWLNDGRWEDDPAAYDNGPPRALQRVLSLDSDAKRKREIDERLARDLANAC